MKKNIDKKNVAIASATAMALLSTLASGFAAFGTNAREAKAIADTNLYEIGGNLYDVPLGKTLNSLIIPSNEGNKRFRNFTIYYTPSEIGQTKFHMPPIMEMEFAYGGIEAQNAKYTITWRAESNYDVSGSEFLQSELLYGAPMSFLANNALDSADGFELPAYFAMVFCGRYSYIVNNSESGYKMPYYWKNDIPSDKDDDSDIYQDAYNKGYDKGKQDGINEGRNEGSNALSAMSWLFGSIVNIPIIVLNGLSEFSVWGLSVIAIAVTLVFVTLVVWLVKKFI